MSPADIHHAWNKLNIIEYYPLLCSIVSEDRNRLQQDLLVIALRLEIYRRQHRKYPSNLKDVYRNGIVSVDPFDPRGETLKYARDSEHSCRIWSNGPDTINNGGTAIGFTIFETDYGYYMGEKIGESKSR